MVRKTHKKLRSVASREKGEKYVFYRVREYWPANDTWYTA